MASKTTHEFRDAVHGFITCSAEEREVLNSRPLQRLRHIHQLAMTYLLYPGATHRRFEHSLGVMELATRIFDTLVSEENLRHLGPNVREIIDEKVGGDGKNYWRKVVRLAALCHDIGHLPFSHGAEELLPPGQNHEWLTWKLITGDCLQREWTNLHITDPRNIAKVAVGAKEASKISSEDIFSDWEALLSEIITGNAFGADRMDYLLRDSLHSGVAYGRFDIDRLIKTLRFLPKPPEGDKENSETPEIGVQIGGLHAAESMLWARHFMFSQVYFHPIRVIYDSHLKDFLRKAMPNMLADDDDNEKFFNLTDNEVLAEIRKRAYREDSPGHDPARRIECREHFKLLYTPTQRERQGNPDVINVVTEAAQKQFGDNSVIPSTKQKSSGSIQFPVWTNNEQSVSAQSESEAIERLPTSYGQYVFVDPLKFHDAKKWFLKAKHDLVQPIILE